MGKMERRITMIITQVTNDTYEVTTCGGLRRLVVTGARLIIRRTGRLGQLVQRLVGFVDATQTRFEATIRYLSDREIGHLLPGIPLDLGVAERLMGRIRQRIGPGQTLELLSNLAQILIPLPSG
jgi:hypothetical protein